MQQFKVSRYNHFFNSQDGTQLAFNAISCGFAKLNDEIYCVVQDILSAPNTYKFDTKEKIELREKLIKGCFLIDERRDEIDILKIRYRGGKYRNNSLGLTIAPTMNCNFKCIYCYEGSQSGTMDSKVIESILYFVEKKMKRVKSLRTTWFGGEPLLALDIIRKLTREFKKLCEIHHCEYRAGIITNGYLLSEKIVTELETLGVKSVQITVDGPPEIHDRRRMLKNGKGTFDVIWKNIKILANLESIHTVIRVNIDSTNREGASEFLDFVDKEELKEKVPVYMGKVSNIYGCANISGECLALANKDFSDFEFSISKEMLKKGYKWFVMLSPRSNRCVADAVSGFVIGPTGHLYKCWNNVGRVEENVGALQSDSYHSNDKLNKWLSWDPFEIEACLNCDYLPICMGNCPFHSLSNEDPNTCCNDEWKHSLVKRLQIYYEFKRYHPEKQEWDTR